MFCRVCCYNQKRSTPFNARFQERAMRPQENLRLVAQSANIRFGGTSEVISIHTGGPSFSSGSLDLDISKTCSGVTRISPFLPITVTMITGFLEWFGSSTAESSATTSPGTSALSTHETCAYASALVTRSAS
eukprot:TRINITY_DN11495_c0_g2_i1.p1 TRINITY_DN11495_c0_g2~~TRINITY_DN11495_c0_g2_i1.p1  ORF type:complete len:132 (-),score=13.16 TRINITY_DN11495_c0_g2_i1:234-629(-)